MKDNILSKIFIFIPLTCTGLVINAPPGDALEAGLRSRVSNSGRSSLLQLEKQIGGSNSIHCAHSLLIARASSESRLIAQNDGGDSAGGTITPDKIRKVVEITLRQKWHAPPAADGAKAVVSFKLMKNGQLFGAPSLKTSAGSPEFDQACIDAAEKVAPFPALPSYLKDIAFVATFHAGKAPWAELAVDESASGGMSLSTSSQSSNSGQSGWTQPSGSAGNNNDGGLAATATGQSDWIDPSASASAGQSGWTQPSGTPPAGGGQSGWTQPTGSIPPEQPDLNVNPETGELQAQPLGLASTAQSLNAPPMKTPAPSAANKKEQPTGKLPPNKNQKPSVHTTPAATPKTPPTNAQNKPGQHNNLAPQQNAQIPQQNMQNQLQNNSQPAQTDMSGSQDLSQRVVLLNNNAVVAIADNNYETAIKKLEEALKIDPTYQQARTNLAIAYNNYGLQLKDRPDDAIKVFHKAFALDPQNEKTRVNLDTIIQYMGKNPKVFKDRLDLGNKALNQGDRLGARIEYEAALAIKPDPITQQKLYAIINGASVQQVNASGQNNQSNQAHGPANPQPGHPVKPGGHAAKPNAPKPTDQTPDNTVDGAPTGVSQKLDTMYRNIKSLELKTFGKPFESDDVLTRLSRLEQKLLGKVQQGKPMRRLDALLILQ